MSATVWVWLVGRVWDQHGRPMRWTCEGLFSSEPAALAACTDERDTVMPLPLDVRLPEPIFECPGAYWAIEKRPELVGRRSA